ncbi:Protein neprosin [Cardamine amara subsp. amara]|uniref:Protein neprosin n=1 Tax=Cardamine amara subsp. amara TaxID=228776 RepID=A0ABD1BMD1_CARAN
MAGPPHEPTIEVGWQVHEFSYGDDKPRLFIYWTSDAYRKTCCYNLRCGGFVPIKQEIAIGGVIPHVSTLDGPQEILPITIWKDPRTGNWWLKFFTHLIVGYWHSSLFNHIQNGATEINWGGEIINWKDGGHRTSTHMGSGRFAEQGWAKASYFNHIEILDESETVKQHLGYVPSVTDANCYNLRSGIDQTVGTFFYYGGHGRNPNCH